MEPVVRSDNPGPTGIADAGYNNFRSGRAVEFVEAAVPAAGVHYYLAGDTPAATTQALNRLNREPLVH